MDSYAYSHCSDVPVGYQSDSGEMALPAIMYALLMNVILLIYVYCCIIRK